MRTNIFFFSRKLEGHPGKPARSLNSGWASQILFLPVVMDVGWTATSDSGFNSLSGQWCRECSSRCFAWVERIFPTNSSYHSWWAVDRKLPKFIHEKTDETKDRIKQLIEIYLEAGSVFGNHHQCFSYFASSSLSWRGPRAVWPTHIPWNVPKKKLPFANMWFLVEQQISARRFSRPFVMPTMWWHLGSEGPRLTSLAGEMETFLGIFWPHCFTDLSFHWQEIQQELFRK